MVFGFRDMWGIKEDRRLFLATVPVLTLGVMGRCSLEMHHQCMPPDSSALQDIPLPRAAYIPEICLHTLGHAELPFSDLYGKLSSILMMLCTAVKAIGRFPSWRIGLIPTPVTIEATGMFASLLAMIIVSDDDSNAVQCSVPHSRCI